MSSRCGLAGLTRAGEWSMSFPAATRARSMLRRERPVEYWAPIRVSFMSVLSGRAPADRGRRLMAAWSTDREMSWKVI